MKVTQDWFSAEEWTRPLISRRRFLATGALAGLSLLAGGSLAACNKQEGPTESSTAVEPVKIGYLPITDATPLLIAHARGLFEEQGLAAEQPTMLRGWSQLAEAFMARSVNLAHLLFPIPIYMRYNLSFPVKVVAWNHLNNSALTVRDGGPIKKAEDLGGKQIAVPYWYSQHNVVLQLILRAAGLEPVIQDRALPLEPNQTNLFVMSPPDMPTALGSNAIDGYIVAEPFNAAGEMLAGGRILRFSGDVWRNHPCCVAVMHEEVVAKQRPWAQKAVNALVRAQRWAIDNREEAARILSKDGRGYIPLPADVIRRSMVKYDLETYGSQGTGAIRHPDWQVRRIGFSPYPYPSATLKLVELMKQTKVEGDAGFLKSLDADRVARELMDYDMVKTAASAAGGITGFEEVNAQTPYERREVIEV